MGGGDNSLPSGWGFIGDWESYCKSPLTMFLSINSDSNLLKFLLVLKPYYVMSIYAQEFPLNLYASFFFTNGKTTYHTFMIPEWPEEGQSYAFLTYEIPLAEGKNPEDYLSLQMGEVQIETDSWLIDDVLALFCNGTSSGSALYRFFNSQYITPPHYLIRSKE